MILAITVTRPDKPRTKATQWFYPDNAGKPLDFDYYEIPATKAMVRLANHIMMSEDDDGSWQALEDTIFAQIHRKYDDAKQLRNFVKHWTLGNDEIDYLQMLGRNSLDELINYQIIHENLIDDRDGVLTI